MNSPNKVLKMTMIALFCALSYICVFTFRIHVGFLTFDIKDTVMAIGGMIFGPLAALAMILVTTLLELVTVSGTGFYGWLMNFISSTTFVLPIALAYAWRKKLPYALGGLACSVFLMTGAMMIANLLITPLYMGVKQSVVVDMIPTTLLPFNLTKSVLNAGLVLILYKPISQALHRAGVHGSKNATEFRFTPVTVAILLVGMLLTVSATLYFFLVMHGSFELI